MIWAYNLSRNSNVALVWSQMDRLQTTPIVTPDFEYLRLIGDRRLAESQFGKTQIDRTEEISRWIEKLKNVEQYEKDVRIGIVAANNNYVGFGPSTVNMFRKIMDMQLLSFENVDVQKIIQQITLESGSNLDSNFNLRFYVVKKEIRDKYPAI